MTASGTSTVHGVSLSWGAHSETGNRRENQDVFLADHPVFLVADGMGGHDDGRSAALTVARSFSTLVGAERVTIEQVRTAIKGARDLIDSRETVSIASPQTALSRSASIIRAFKNSSTRVNSRHSRPAPTVSAMSSPERWAAASRGHRSRTSGCCPCGKAIASSSAVTACPVRSPTS